MESGFDGLLLTRKKISQGTRHPSMWDNSDMVWINPLRWRSFHATVSHFIEGSAWFTWVCKEPTGGQMAQVGLASWPCSVLLPCIWLNALGPISQTTKAVQNSCIVDSARPFLFNTGPDISLRWPTSHDECTTPFVIVVVTMERIYLDWEKKTKQKQ